MSPDPEPIPPDPTSDPGAAPARPNWLVGPEEGLASEMDAKEHGDGPRPAAPVLVRPDAGSAIPAPRFKPVAAPEPTAPGPRPPEPIAEGGGAIERGFAFGSAPVQAESLEFVNAFDGATGGSMRAAEERESIAPDEADVLPAAGAEAAPRPALRLVAVEPPPPVTPPWWQGVIDRVREDRRVQIAIGGVALIAGLVALWPTIGPGDSVAAIRKHAERYESRPVRVKGRVGDDVFPVGGGCTYYLLQGRDTMVVFSRSHVPQRHEHLTVAGTVSTGFLNGEQRQALFEDPTAK